MSYHSAKWYGMDAHYFLGTSNLDGTYMPIYNR